MNNNLLNLLLDRTGICKVFPLCAFFHGFLVVKGIQRSVKEIIFNVTNMNKKKRLSKILPFHRICIQKAVCTCESSYVNLD